MLVDISPFWQYLGQFFWKNVSKISVFSRHSDFFGDKQSYLSFLSWVDQHFQDEKSHIYHKSFDIFIQRRFNKLFFIDESFSIGSW